MRERASRWIPRAAFITVAVLAIWSAAADYGAAPYGQWDAWAIWNQKARFLVRGGIDWTAALTIPWANPAHPLLVPAAVARLWAYAGSETTLVPAAVALTFGGSIVAVVMGAIGLGSPRAWVAGAVLLAPGLFVQQVTSQQADVPLAFFIVAVVVIQYDWLMAPPGRDPRVPLVVGGVLGGLAAWTKNEGVLFLAAILPLLVWTAWRRGRVGDVVRWYAAAAPIVLTVMWLKLVLAPVPPPYLLEAQTSGTMLGRMFGAEGAAMLRMAGRRIVGWGGPLVWGAAPAALAVAAVGWVRGRGRDTAAGGLLLLVALMGGGYAAVFIATPLDAVTLIADTMDRLLTQIWPLVVFAAAVAVSPRSNGTLAREP